MVIFTCYLYKIYSYVIIKNFLKINKKITFFNEKSNHTAHSAHSEHSAHSDIEQKIIFIKSNRTINLIKNQNNFEYHTNKIIRDKLLDKKILHIRPGGVYGFYDSAICGIIKDKYNLKDYIFNGASAGSYNSLFMTYKHDHNKLIKLIFFQLKQNKFTCIKTLQQELKKTLLANTSTKDFDLDKLFITVCVWDNYKFNNYIYTDFDSLESAIDCCVASSNIPFLTGDLIYRYRGKISYDGGFLKKSHIIIKNPHFIVSNSLFGKKRFFTSIFDSKKNIFELYNEGINDCVNNINNLDNLFIDCDDNPNTKK